MSQYPYYTEPTHDTGTVAAAARTTAVSSAEGRLKVDASDKIMLLQANKHPLVALLTQVGKTADGANGWKGSGIQKMVTGNPSFDWFEDFYGGRYCKVSGTYSTGAVTVTVTGAGTSSAYIFTVGDVVMNARTGERFLVDTIASTTTITLAANGRGYGSTAAAAGADGDELYRIGNVNQENASARNANSTRTTKETNYTQIFRTSITISNTEKASKLYGGPDLPYQRAKMGEEHALDIEESFWFGEKKTDGNTTHPQRATGGILEFIEAGNSYVQNQGGVLTAPDLEVFLREGFTYGNNQKYLMAGGLLISAINEIARGQINTVPSTRTYGMKITEWVSGFGTINIVHNPLFVGNFAGYGFLLDLECFKYRFMEGRDTVLNTNIQGNSEDGEVDEYLTECGLQRMQAPRSALIKGVTG